MSEILVGDRVICTADFREDIYTKEGVVKQEWCEYGDHVFGVNFDDGTYGEEGVEYFEHVVDPYEYAPTWNNHEGGFWEVFESEWGSREEAEIEAKSAADVGNIGTKVVKRRKAGLVADV